MRCEAPHAIKEAAKKTAGIAPFLRTWSGAQRRVQDPARARFEPGVGLFYRLSPRPTVVASGAGILNPPAQRLPRQARSRHSDATI